MSALDELLRQWRSNPDAEATIALCSFLGNSAREELIAEVAASAETWHPEDAQVMLAVGRMHLDAGLLAEAQASLVLAGKANGRHPSAFRFLGEVLLRRGDAVRAEKVLARALQLDPKEAEARVWHDLSVVYSALQKRVGVEAVAAEVQRAMPKQNSIPPPMLQPQHAQAFGNEELTRPQVESPFSVPAVAEALPRFQSEPRVPPSASDWSAPVPTRGLPAPRVSRATSAGLGPPGPKLPNASANAARLPRPSPPVRSAARLPAAVQALPPTAAAAPNPTAARPLDIVSDAPPGERVAEGFEDVITMVTPAPFIAPSWPSAPSTGAQRSAPLTTPARTPLPFQAAAETLPAILPSPLANAAEPPIVAPASFQPGVGVPEPALVLEHLSRVGIYEPGGGAAPAWERPARAKGRGNWALALAIVLVAVAGGGSYQYSKKVRGERLQHAAALNEQVKKLLETASLADLKSTDQKLNASFELDSLSQPAARLWLQNRVLYELLTGDEVRGIDSAIHRGKAVQLPDKDTAFAKIASFMAEGDLAGGAAILARWDTDSGRDPYYQLVAGAVLERAGDARALERYSAAQRLDPDFIPAQLLLARLLVLEFGAERARPALQELQKRLGDVPTTRALGALSWVVDPERPETLPEPAQLRPGDAEQLPAPLIGVPSMVEAVQAMRAGDLPAVSHAIDSALASAMTPSLATALGFLAIEAGDPQLARKAALRALQFAAVYPRARTLAARVALLDGRLDEAQKAIEELSPSAPEVAIVRGVVAYESLEPSDLEAALRAIGEAARSGPTYAALAAGPGLLTGRVLPSPEAIQALAAPKTAWGELIATDAALDSGDLKLAAKIMDGRPATAQRPVHALRLARLHRYRNENAEALKAGAAARTSSTTPSVLVESVYGFLKADDSTSARNLLAQHPTTLGPLTGWLGVLVDAASKQNKQAAARAAKLDLPPSETPLALRILAARSLVAAQDKRARSYVLLLAKQAPKHPDVIEAALELNR